MRFIAYFLFSAFVFSFVVFTLYGVNHLIGNARELDRNTISLLIGLLLFVSTVMGVAGANGWLKRKK